MRKLVWLVALAIPPWIASDLEAPKWVLLISVATFFLLAMNMGNHEEDLLGDASPISAGSVSSSLPLAASPLVSGLFHVASLLP
ncbi:MAG: hypothetical protein IPK97_08420 [Ahniella sp.]|nr:hypothetical protein [Ahniella sp.]